MEKDKREVVLSGIRATGKLHLGNYLGAMKYFVELSRDNSKKCMFFIANLHTLTTKINPGEIQDDLKEIVLDYLSVGIDPESSIIFAQSSVPETCELSWMLSCLAQITVLERLPHFKEKRGKVEEKEGVNSGLLMYPVLMAADILGPHAALVPVGEDQHPHVELARELARRFNARFGETFPIPRPLLQEAIRVPGLDGSGKMGKSDGNTIDLSDSPETVMQKLKVAVTDTSRVRRSDPGDPSICNICKLHELLSSQDEIDEIRSGCANAKIGCFDCKTILAHNINTLLIPVQSRRRALLHGGNSLILDILHDGGKKARDIIAPNVEVAKKAMGIPFY